MCVLNTVNAFFSMAKDTIIISKQVRLSSGNEVLEYICLFLFQHNGIELEFILNVPIRSR